MGYSRELLLAVGLSVLHNLTAFVCGSSFPSAKLASIVPFDEVSPPADSPASFAAGDQGVVHISDEVML